MSGQDQSGSTLTMVALSPTDVVCANTGDSRCARFCARRVCAACASVGRGGAREYAGACARASTAAIATAAVRLAAHEVSTGLGARALAAHRVRLPAAPRPA